MKTMEGRLGRMFILRLEEGDRLPDSVEAFAREQGVQSAWVAFTADAPAPGAPAPADASALGLVAPDDVGRPALRLYGRLGPPEGSFPWRGQAAVWELTGVALRWRASADPKTGAPELVTEASPGRTQIISQAALAAELARKMASAETPPPASGEPFTLPLYALGAEWE